MKSYRENKLLSKDFLDSSKDNGMEYKMRLANSTSAQNMYLTYVCLVNNVNPTGQTDQGHVTTSYPTLDTEEIEQEDEPIKVERSKAHHELHDVNETHNGEIENSDPITSDDCSDFANIDYANFLSCDNANILKLTKMKWLTEGRDGSADASPVSASPTTSASSLSSTDEEHGAKLNDKYLSTIIQLDKEHNMFGISNIAIVKSQPSKKIKKDSSKGVFHQTAIVQICCEKTWCKHRSNTDLPSSLKCGGCQGCYSCLAPVCSSCSGACPSDRCRSPPRCPTACTTCPKGKCRCKLCTPKCYVDCTTCFGLKISVNKKPEFKPTPIELTPRSSCILQKPVAARSCHHVPQCLPPSSCFPYLMPCYWPSRPSAPCNTPATCFHNPPCLAPRKPKLPVHPGETCPKGKPCEDSQNKITCPNLSCLGQNQELKKALEKYGKK